MADDTIDCPACGADVRNRYDGTTPVCPDCGAEVTQMDTKTDGSGH